MRFVQLALLAPLVGTSLAAPTTKRSNYSVKERHPVPARWSKKGAAPKDHNLNIQIGLTQQNQEVLEQHALEVSDPAHPRYGQHLSADEVHALVAPADESIALLQDWLVENGISSGKISPAKDWINVAIPVAKAEQLLDTVYSIFQHADSSTLVRAPEWSLPEHLHEHIEVVQPTTAFFRPGKQSSDLIKPSEDDSWHSVSWVKEHWHPGPSHLPYSDPRANVSGICNASFVTLECLRTLYGTIDYVPQVPEQNSIAITDFLTETVNRSDLHLYLESFRPEAARYAYEFPIIRINNGTDIQYNRTDGNGVEGDLDGDLVVGISYPTNFTAYNTGGEPPIDYDLGTPTNTNEAYVAWLNYVLAQQDLPNVISTSYGDDEQTVPYSYAVRACNGYKLLAARGISVLVSSGDSGVGPDGACYSNKDNSTYMFLPAFPTSCPWVTSVGGTANFTPEVAVSRFGSGGGFSNYFGRPAYQNSAVEGYLGKIGELYAGDYNSSGRAYPVSPALQPVDD